MALVVGVLIVRISGDSIGLPLKGEADLARPGSETGAKVQEGFPRNLGGPAFDQLIAALRHGAI
jgi:hypothetical protein